MMPAPLTITTHIGASDAVQLTVAGEVDLSNSDTLREQIVAVLASHRPAELIVDLDQVTFMDSMGIRVLLTTRRAAQDDGATYRVINARRNVLRILEIAGVADLLRATKDPDRMNDPDAATGPA